MLPHNPSAYQSDHPGRQLAYVESKEAGCREDQGAAKSYIREKSKSAQRFRRARRRINNGSHTKKQIAPQRNRLPAGGGRMDSTTRVPLCEATRGAAAGRSLEVSGRSRARKRGGFGNDLVCERGLATRNWIRCCV